MASKRKAPKRWVQGAIRKPGALRRRMIDLGLAKKDRPIPMAALKRAAGGEFGPQTARRARLAITMRGFRRKR